MPPRTPRTPRRTLIAGEIRAELARRGFSAADLADATGITRATLRRRLAGESPFNFDELAAVSAHLELPLAVIVERAEQAAVSA